MSAQTNWLERLLFEYIKEMGIKDKFHLIQKLLKEIEKDLSILQTKRDVIGP